MLPLLRFVRDGQVPLLGPPTSIGDFHHGAAYYFLLAPAAWLSGSDPVAVLAAIAALGTAAVGVTWWLARAIGGRGAGGVGAAPPGGARRPRGGAVAVAGAGMVLQLHVLGIVFLPPILALGTVDAIRASRIGDGDRARRALAGMAAGMAVIALLFVPLLVHELQTGFEETGRFVAYFTGRAGAGSVSTLDPLQRLVFTAFRIVGWPLVGLVTSAPLAAIVSVSGALVLGLWLMVAGRGAGRTIARWLGLTIARG